MEEGRRGRRPTAEEVIAKLKDDGDFDSLRLKIIRKIKENEELRNSIIMEVKQSEILNEDGSENLKPRQISDAIYQELGKKIMGQISDEVWKVIRNDSTKNDIKETVESVYDRIVNPKPKEDPKPKEGDQRPSPAKDNASKQNGASTVPTPAEQANADDGNAPQMPPGSAPSGQQTDNPEHKEAHCEQQFPHLPSEEELHNPTNMVEDDDDMPPGFTIPATGPSAVKVSPGINTIGDGAAAAADMPPGFDTDGHAAANMPPGFSTGAGSIGATPPGLGAFVAVVNDDDDDDPDVPPGFG